MTHLPTSALRNAAHAALVRGSIPHATELLSELARRTDLRNPLWEPRDYLIAACFGRAIALVNQVNASVARAA